MEFSDTPTTFPSANFSLAPFNYHHKVRDHFKSRKKTWDWFKSDELKEKQVTDFKSNLLKNTYRLDKEAHQNLYDLVADVCQKLSIDAQVTLYQENNSVQLNAGIVALGKEAHIVLSGNLLSLLSDEEMKALLGHELSHYLFNKINDEEFEVTQRIILALANDNRSEDAIIETARIYQLYLELFCDAGSLRVCNDYKTVIQTLVKLNTGLTNVNAESYLAQANEIILNDAEATQNHTHPESYIRSLALQLRAQNDPEYLQKIENLIQGNLDLNSLDIFEQVTMADITMQMLQILVKPHWMNSATLLNLAAQYFKDFFKKKEDLDVNIFRETLVKTKDSVKNYLCYVLLDFAKVDAELENAPLAYTLEISELLGLEEEYEKLIRKELKLTVRDFKLLKDSAMAELQQVKEGKEDSIYKD